MPIRESKKIRLSILQLLADGAELSSQEIRERLRVQFKIAPHEDRRILENGKTAFNDEVDRALANLQGAPRGSKRIEKVGEQVYRINEIGKDYLKQNS